MRLLHAFSCLAPIVGAAAAPSTAPGEAQLATLEHFRRYIDYAGPTDAELAALDWGPKRRGSVDKAAVADAPYWLAQLQHRGVAAFNPNTAYKVFRNVKDYGAKGDGITDDTAAIQRAISDGNRCAPGKCQGSTTTPAIVYIPSGTYVISSSLVDYYLTQIIGNPNGLPVFKATAGFSGFGVIDGDQYQAGGVLGFLATNLFYRQVKNLIIDLTGVPATSSVTGIHWPTAQATSLQNIVFKMSTATGTQHQGLFIESGSGGLLADLVFYGGLQGAVLGSQQFTVHNLTFYNAVTAINQIYDWGWTYKSITVSNCGVGLDLTSGGRTAQNVGSVTFIDSTFINTGVAFNTSRDSTSQPAAAGSLILENVAITNTPIVVRGPQKNTVLAGTTGSSLITGWGQGHEYLSNGPTTFAGGITPVARPASLLSGTKYYERSKPSYANFPVSAFLSVRSTGAAGNGVTDDTAALQSAINWAATTDRVLFVDSGIYRITRTLTIWPGLRIVGEAYPVLLSSGPTFANAATPVPVVRVGLAGQTGAIEWSDMIVATQGAQAGATLIEWNLSSPGTPSGMWDVHTRIGGFVGSELQVAQCVKTPTTAIPPRAPNPQCYGAYLSLHITPSASGVYVENSWLWVADHDIDDATATQITVYAGRGLLDESRAGRVWLVGTAVEHHALYQYQFLNTASVFMGQIQTETAYYQPNPVASLPFALNGAIADPDYKSYCAGKSGNCNVGLGLRIVNSTGLFVYGAGLYSFFDNYSTTCSAAGNGETCQTRIFSIEGPRTADVVVYNLNTVGAVSMIDRNGNSLAKFSDNVSVFPDTVALYRTG